MRGGQGLGWFHAKGAPDQVRGSFGRRWAIGTLTDRLRANEKLKDGSSVIANLGSALVAAGFGRWFVLHLDAWAFIWIVFGATGIVMAIQAMSFLESEKADE